MQTALVAAGGDDDDDDDEVMVLSVAEGIPFEIAVQRREARIESCP